MKKRIAVIGAGISGLACARALCKQGHDVVVYEKSRGPGGRTPTRWLNREIHPPLGFDHGAQYFQVTNPEFKALIDEAEKAGAVDLWHGHVVDLSYGREQTHAPGAQRWVGKPGMAALGRFLSEDLNLQTQTRVVGVMRKGLGYALTLHLQDGVVRVDDDFDAVVSAIPAEQTYDLFAESHLELAQKAAGVSSSITWTVMLTLAQPLRTSYDGAFVVDSPLGWICRDSSKPGRADGERWVLHATANWSAQHRDETPDNAAKALLDVFSSVTGHLVDPLYVSAHRWLYSLPVHPLDEGYYLDEAAMLGACGDWLSGARVEDAYLSGLALANRLLQARNSALV